MSIRQVVRSAVCAALLAGCTGGGGEVKGHVDAAPATPVASPEATDEALEALLAGELERALCARGEALARAEAVRAAIKRGEDKRLGVGERLKHGDVLGRVYGEGGEWGFVGASGGLSARGEAVRAALEAAGEHGLAPDVLGVERLKAALEGAKGVNWSGCEGATARLAVKVEPEAVRALWARAAGDVAAKRAAVVEGVYAGAAGEAVRAWGKRAGEALAAAAWVEIAAAEGFLLYARELKHGNIAGVDWRAIKAAGGSRKLVAGRLEGALRELLALDEGDADKIAEALRGLEPTHPQYAALKRVRARYAQVVAAGGWERLEGVGGKRLWARLEAEGYARGEYGEASLREAVRAYQRAHQLPVGEQGQRFWRSVNVPASKRLEQIEAAMGRMRAQGRHEGEQTFLYINLPYFRGELWENGSLKHVFSVVIGKANRVCNDKSKRWELPNATPLLKSELEYFMLNPVWYVPDRIVEEEIRPKAEKDERWLEENHYEVVSKKKDKWEVRQRPGPWNALGQVKFIFPNPHNTYMHDTSHREYFGRTIRAYSHGCIRVEEPLRLASALAEVDDQAVEVGALVEEGRTKMVKMKNKIPVLIEYYTVHVDEADQAHFLVDIYGLEDPALGGEELDCTKSRGRRPAVSDGPSRGDIGP
jgi:murein L,D-transpeptidase YcbB/YkuD